MRSIFCLIVKLVISALYFLFDCYVGDKRTLFFCLIVMLVISALYFLFDCYVSDKCALFSV